MAYTEIKTRNKKKYYYRVLSVRDVKKINKKRIYLGMNLNKKELSSKEKIADDRLKSNKKLNSIEKIKPKIIEILKKNKIKKAGIFGSYATGKQKKNSDIDILIEPTKNMGLEFVGLSFELEEKLGKKVDLVTYNGISPYLKERILNEEVRIL